MKFNKAILTGTVLVSVFAENRLPAQASYHYFKEERALAEDGNRIAVLRTQSARTRAGVESDLARQGLSVTNLEPFTVDGWWVGEIDAAVTTSGTSVRDVVSSASLETDNEFVSPVFKGDNGGSVIVTPVILVRFEDGVSPSRAEAILKKAGAGSIVEKDFGNMPGTYRLQLKSRDGYTVLGIANDLAKMPEVRFAEPDMMFTGQSQLTPNDPGFSQSWGLHNTGQSGGTVDEDMDAPEAWDISLGSSTIKVLVLDNGVQQDHPDINQLPGIDTTSESPGTSGGPVNDCDRHGTPVAGCISGIANNGIGGAGIAPGCIVLSARTFISTSNCSGSWTSAASWTVNSLAWGETNGARVSNNSNYYGFTSSSIADKYAQTKQNGMVHFGSAGNNTTSSLSYPASLPTVNAVAALNRYGGRASFSNYGTGLDFSAPGESIYTTDRTGSLGYGSSDYTFVNGTSFASPYAAGVAALILSVNPLLTPQDVEQILQTTSADKGVTGYGTDYGWGAVNAHDALQSLASSVTGWMWY